MASHSEEKDEENLEVLKEERTLTPGGGKLEEIRGQVKAKDSKGNVTPVGKKDIAQDSARRKDRREEIKEEEKERDSKDHVTSAEFSDTARIIAGPQEKEREVKEEHI